MWIVGLTGPLGAGKSTLSQALHLMGIPIRSADQDVHHFLASDEEVQCKVRAIWPEVFNEGIINRKLLGERVLASSLALTQLEGILYPKLAKHLKKFLITHQKLNVPIVVLDMPLLMEVGLDQYCHCVIFVDAPLSIRKRRVLMRPGMTEEKFEAITSQQMQDKDRRGRADFVILTGRDKVSAVKRLLEIICLLKNLPSPKWDGRWPTGFKKDKYGKGNRFRHRNNRF